jgi:hypothetical protein
MKTCFLALTILVMIIGNAFSQAVDSTITIEKKKYYMNEQLLKGAQLKSLLKYNRASSDEFHKYQVHSGVAGGLILAGAASACYGAYKMYDSSKEQNDDLNNGQLPTEETELEGGGFALLGLGLVVAAIPFSVISKKHLKESVRLYNSSLSTQSSNRIQYKLLVSANRVGIQLVF